MRFVHGFAPGKADVSFSKFNRKKIVNEGGAAFQYPLLSKNVVAWHLGGRHGLQWVAKVREEFDGL